MLRSRIQNSIRSFNQISGGGFTGLLDEYGGAAAAYSVRRLSSSYTGNLIEVRRTVSAVTVTADVSFDSNNELSLDSEILVTGGSSNATNLGEFVAAAGYSDPDSLGSGQNAFVRTWYDQSGNGNNAQQTITSSQPQIVSSGSNLGYLAMAASATGLMPFGYNYVLSTQYSSFKVVQNNGNCVFGGATNPSLFYATATSGGAGAATLGFTNPSYFSSGSPIGTTRGDIDTATNSIAQLTSLFTGIAVEGGIGYNSATFNNSRFKEFILYPNQTVSRTGVENNQISYYGLS